MILGHDQRIGVRKLNLQHAKFMKIFPNKMTLKLHLDNSRVDQASLSTARQIEKSATNLGAEADARRAVVVPQACKSLHGKCLKFTYNVAFCDPLGSWY